MPLSDAHKMVAFMPYLGKDFGMEKWLSLQQEAWLFERSVPFP